MEGHENGNTIMSPKKVPRFAREALEALSRPEIQELGRELRKEGIEIGSLSRSTADIVTELLALKKLAVDVAPDQSKVDEHEPNGLVVDVDAEVAELEVKLAAARIRAQGAQGGGALGGGAKTPAQAERTRLAPPSTLFGEPTHAIFLTWQKEVLLWTKTHAAHSQGALVSSLLTAVNETMKGEVFACHGEEAEMTVESVMAVLSERYGGDVLEARRVLLGRFRGCKREKQPLSVWLPNWTSLRAQCVQQGLLSSLDSVSESECWDLLDAAQLTASQRAAIMHELSTRESLRTEMNLPPMTSPARMKRTLELLRELALSFVLGGESQGKGKGRGPDSAALVADGMPRNLAARNQKGKGQKGKGSRKGAKGGGAKAGKGAKGKGAKTGKGDADWWNPHPGRKGDGKGKKKGSGSGSETCYRCQQAGHRAFECTAPAPVEAGGAKKEL